MSQLRDNGYLFSACRPCDAYKNATSSLNLIQAFWAASPLVILNRDITGWRERKFSTHNPWFGVRCGRFLSSMGHSLLPEKGGVQSSYWCCVHSTRLPLCRKRVQALHERKLQFEICNHPWVIEDINHSNVKRILQLLLLNIVYNSIDNQFIRLVCPFADTHIVVYCLLLFPRFVELTYWISYALYNQFTSDTRFVGLIKNFGNYFITRYRELGSSLNQTTMVVPLAFDVFRGWTALVLVVLTSGELRWTHVTFAALEILCSNFTWLNTIVYNIHLSLFTVGSKHWLHIQKWTPICMTSHLLL